MIHEILRVGPLQCNCSILGDPESREAIVVAPGGDVETILEDDHKLIAGDTLFSGSIGRTDLLGGSFEKIMRSLHDRVLQLPDETVVVPGHGDLTTIGEERQSNPFLRTGGSSRLRF